MSDENPTVALGRKIGCLMIFIFGACITGIVVALTIKLIMWMFGL